jgi:hypothetical protein
VKNQPVDDRGARICREVTGWPGVSTAVGEYGETEFIVRGREIGHVHGSRQADIPFPRRLRDELVDAGRTGPHHIHADSGWTTLYIRSDADADEVVAQLRLNYDRVTARAARSAAASD